MQVHGPTQLHGAQPIGAPHTSRISQPPSTAPSGPIQDEVQISEAGRLADQASEVPEVREDRVNQIRAEIASGTYETEEKLNLAVERLLDEIG